MSESKTLYHALDLKPAEFVRNVHALTAPIGATIEDVLQPEFWKHVSVRMRARDRVEVVAEDGSFFAELFVVMSDKNFAKVALLRHTNLAEAKTTQHDVVSEDFVVAWGSRQTKYRVIRKSDKEVLRDGFESAALANTWLTTYLESLKA